MKYLRQLDANCSLVKLDLNHKPNPFVNNIVITVMRQILLTTWAFPWQSLFRILPQQYATGDPIQRDIKRWLEFSAYLFLYGK